MEKTKIIRDSVLNVVTNTAQSVKTIKMYVLSVIQTLSLIRQMNVTTAKYKTAMSADLELLQDRRIAVQLVKISSV